MAARAETRRPPELWNRERSANWLDLFKAGLLESPSKSTIGAQKHNRASTKMPGITKAKPNTTHQVASNPVLKNGHQRWRKTRKAERSLSGRKGVAASCVTIIATIPEMIDPVRNVARPFNPPSTTSKGTRNGPTLIQVEC